MKRCCHRPVGQLKLIDFSLGQLSRDRDGGDSEGHGYVSSVLTSDIVPFCKSKRAGKVVHSMWSLELLRKAQQL